MGHPTPIDRSLNVRANWAQFVLTAMKQFPTDDQLWELVKTGHNTEHEAELDFWFFKAVAMACFVGEHFFVEKNFSRLVAKTAVTVPSDTQWHHSLCVTSSGWAALEEPVTGVCDFPIQLIVWHPATTGETETPVIYIALCPEPHPGALMNFRFSAPQEGEMIIHDSDVTDPQTALVARFILSFFYMLQQKITSVEPARTTGKIVERLKKHSSMRFHNQPHQIILRRASQPRSERNEGSGREYQCQWVVTEHWRKQPYKSTGEVRPILIQSYIKGPENKPMKAPEPHVFVARR